MGLGLKTSPHHWPWMEAVNSLAVTSATSSPLFLQPFLQHPPPLQEPTYLFLNLFPLPKIGNVSYSGQFPFSLLLVCLTTVSCELVLVLVLYQSDIFILSLLSVTVK